MIAVVQTCTDDGLPSCAGHPDLPLLATGVCWLCCDTWRAEEAILDEFWGDHPRPIFKGEPWCESLDDPCPHPKRRDAGRHCLYVDLSTNRIWCDKCGAKGSMWE